MIKIEHISSKQACFQSYFVNDIKELNQFSWLNDEAKASVLKQFDLDLKQVSGFDDNGWEINLIEAEKGAEYYREQGAKLLARLNAQKVNSVQIKLSETAKTTFLLEGLQLASYRFLKYFKEEAKKEKAVALQNVYVDNSVINETQLNELNTICEAVFVARDLVNEPQSYLNAVQYSNDIKQLGSDFGFEVEVLEKTKIESLKMGGLLAVNKGSVIPPTFNILTYKSNKAVNEKPLVLVGKGIVYDTGGLSLKPTANSMDLMKCDMAGSAAVVGAMCAIAKAKLPVNVVAFVPATDNRPGLDAYAPGDVIAMHNGLTVEVKNTDAEGRLVLADAMSYAEKYEPECLVELATLTGSAVAAIGSEAAVVMGTDDSAIQDLKTSGENVYERLVEFPFWSEYDEQLKSDIADLKNLGGPTAGAITAGKFLANFTTAPYVHIDVAGPAFIDRESAYRTKGGTGYGVRLLFDFIKTRYNG